MCAVCFIFAGILQVEFTFNFDAYSNQEHLEKLKDDINEQRRREHEHHQAADHSKLVLNSIKSTIIDLILKLQEIDETNDPMNLGGFKFELMNNPFIDLSCDNISNDFLLQVSVSCQCERLLLDLANRKIIKHRIRATHA